MGEYIINEKFKSMSVKGIFKMLLDFCRNKPTYCTLSGNKSHKISEILDDRIKVERLGDGIKVERLKRPTDTPILTFDEIKEVIGLLKKDKIINTNSNEYKELLAKPVNKTPLLSLLKASNIIVDY
ncbi:MAG: hypothetical protein KKA62_01250 [Nanoarchaeota archaeon]|nr:hypothetical protein [Nanoarchaeota archaeon]MBU1976560.1 hypothetical protein [Nanoarchaeota archaeon]